MKTFNTTIAGVIVSDVKLDDSDSNVICAFFRLAIGNLQRDTVDLLDVICYSHLINAVQPLRKGQSVTMQGYLRPKMFKTDQNEDALTLEYVCAHIALLEEPPKDEA